MILSIDIFYFKTVIIGGPINVKKRNIVTSKKFKIVNYRRIDRRTRKARLVYYNKYLTCECE